MRAQILSMTTSQPGSKLLIKTKVLVDEDQSDALSVQRRSDLDEAIASLSLKQNTQYNYDDTEVEQVPLPEHACHYCAVHNPTAILKCTACSRWFCNGRQGGSGAHVVQHLVRSKHRELALHPDSLVGETALECYVCGNRNIFALGWVCGKEDPGLVVILCRVQCPHAAAKTGEWDPNTWKPLIEERAITSLLVNVPN
jgi:regulator of nonsense transcripts 1